MSYPATEENRDRRGGMLEVDNQLVDAISALVQGGQQGMVQNLIADLHPPDLANLISHLSFEDGNQLFDWLPVEVGREVLAELDSALRSELL